MPVAVTTTRAGLTRCSWIAFAKTGEGRRPHAQGPTRQHGNLGFVYIGFGANAGVHGASKVGRFAKNASLAECRPGYDERQGTQGGHESAYDCPPIMCVLSGIEADSNCVTIFLIFRYRCHILPPNQLIRRSDGRNHLISQCLETTRIFNSYADSYAQSHSPM